VASAPRAVGVALRHQPSPDRALIVPTPLVDHRPIARLSIDPRAHSADGLVIVVGKLVGGGTSFRVTLTGFSRTASLLTEWRVFTSGGPVLAPYEAGYVEVHFEVHFRASVGPRELSRRRLIDPKGRAVMALVLLWLLGAPLTLILILFLLGVGR
jgi:hypothetical protein